MCEHATYFVLDSWQWGEGTGFGTRKVYRAERRKCVRCGRVWIEYYAQHVATTRM